MEKILLINRLLKIQELMGSLVAHEQRKLRYVDKPKESVFQSKVTLSSQRKFKRDNSISSWINKEANDGRLAGNESQIETGETKLLRKVPGLETLDSCKICKYSNHAMLCERAFG